MLKRIIQGKPFKHPVHPMLVHFPIGLFSFSFLMDVAGKLFPDHHILVAGALYSMIAGICFALVASVPGFVDYSDIRKGHPARKIATYHMILNLVVVVLYTASAVWRVSAGIGQAPSLGPFVVALVAYGLLGISGYLGGHLVYDDGVAVGRHRRPSDAPPETVRPTGEHREKGTAADFVFIPVIKASELKEGEALRVEAKGFTVTCVRDRGEIFAFQEYCTHRFGPLSEGTVRDGHIQCPWHNSCFDIRNGRVTEGPAKVPLKVFPTQVRENTLYVGFPVSARGQALADAA
jgi:nitrite reductase/ring-hydroxylating ferredoxin subunit/uncharacterized membrane protein